MGNYVISYHYTVSPRKGVLRIMAKVNYINVENIYPLTYAALYDQASDYRRKKADKYNKQEDALTCILSEAMLRYALKQSGLNVLLTPKKDGNGKPYIEGENFKFNVSYAGKYVAIAYGETEIGIDVEEIFIDSGRELVAKYYYTETEYNEIFKDGIEENNALQFAQIWTMKECYLKYLGTEKNRPLASFTANRDSGTVTDLSGSVIEGIRLRSAFPDEDHCISVCTEDSSVDFSEITVDELLGALGITK